MSLVAADPVRAAEHLSKVYEWRYSEQLTAAKALVAAALAIGLAPVVPILQPDTSAPISMPGVFALYGSALVLVVVGVVQYFRSRRIHNEYLAAQTLLGRLVEIRPFLRLYEESLR
jgi:hypothetical protein